MNTSAGYQQYEKNKILTASPAELTLMLYDGAIKYANIAIMAIDKGDVEKAHNSIRRVERIIESFRIHLISSILLPRISMRFISISGQGFAKPMSRRTRRL